MTKFPWSALWNAFKVLMIAAYILIMMWVIMTFMFIMA